jgi:predicted AAA+ superfamily ATPase
VAHFHEYLLRRVPAKRPDGSITAAQSSCAKTSSTRSEKGHAALFGVRHVLELEQVFLYLCLHGGGLLDMQALCGDLELKKPTVNNFINLLESTHLIYKLPPFGYGKEILRARNKVYLADAAISPSVLLKGASLLEDPAALGVAVETAFFKHLFARYYSRSVGFSYWRGKREREVDIVAEVEAA